MGDKISFDGLTLAGVANDEDGEVGSDTVFRFEQTGERIYANYSGGDIADGLLVGTLDGGAVGHQMHPNKYRIPCVCALTVE